MHLFLSLLEEKQSNSSRVSGGLCYMKLFAGSVFGNAANDAFGLLVQVFHTHNTCVLS